MKKWIALILSVVMVLGLTACGGGQSGNGETASRNESQSKETETLEPAGNPETTEGKTLVVYYSATGNTEEAAKSGVVSKIHLYRS